MNTHTKQMETNKVFFLSDWPQVSSRYNYYVSWLTKRSIVDYKSQLRAISAQIDLVMRLN